MENKDINIDNNIQSNTTGDNTNIDSEKVPYNNDVYEKENENKVAEFISDINKNAKEEIEEAKIKRLENATKNIEIITDIDVLHKKGRIITQENWEEAYECGKNLTRYLSQNDNALGVAAQQLGYDLMMFAMRYKETIIMVINPSIQFIKPTKYSFKTKEECLSIPNRTYNVKRCSIIKARFNDYKMKWIEKRFTDIWAVVFQHEYDHINGLLISDKGIEIKQPVDYKL